MRRWDAAGHVSPARWENAAEFLHRADVAILSREDVGGDEAYIADLARKARLLVVTDGWHGATLYMGGEGIASRRGRPPKLTRPGPAMSLPPLSCCAWLRPVIRSSRLVSPTSSPPCRSRRSAWTGIPISGRMWTHWLE